MRSRIQIDSRADRLNLVLHGGLNTALLGAAVVYGGEVSLIPLSVAGFYYAAKGIFPLFRAYTFSFGIVGLVNTHPIQRAKRRFARRLGMEKAPYLGLLNGVFDSRTLTASATKDEILISPALMKALNLRQQMAIVGHELTHIGKHHIRNCYLAALPARMACGVLVGDGLAVAVRTESGPGPLAAASGLALLCGAAAFLVNRHLQRVMEYEADRGAALLTTPSAMISLLRRLEKIEDEEDIFDTQFMRDMRGMDLSLPLKLGIRVYGAFLRFHKHPAAELLDEHPPLRKRIARLEAMRARRPPAAPTKPAEYGHPPAA